MSRLIDIDELKGCAIIRPTTHEEIEHIRACKNLISHDDIPTAMERSTVYYNDGWIPVSERLPERCEWYLVTYKFHDLPKATCHELYYGDEYGYEQRWYLDDEYTELDAPFDVIAWRELPAPYKPKGEK